MHYKLLIGDYVMYAGPMDCSLAMHESYLRLVFY